MIFKDIIKQIRFPKFDNKTKKLFIADYNKKTIPYFRLSVIMVIIVSFPFAWLDLELIPSNVNFVWIIRFGIWLPMFVLAYFISYKSVYIKYFQIIVSFIILVLGLGISAMIFVSNKSDMAFTMYYIGIPLIMIGVIIFRLRFIASLIILTIVSFSYLLTAIFKQNLLFINGPINYQVVFINNTVFLLSFAIIVSLASYILENYARNIFIQQQIIKEKNEELIASEEELRQNNEELEAQRDIVYEQKEKIEEKNGELNLLVEEVTSQRDEIESQRDKVVTQKEIIEKIHYEISESINYATRLQEAILPEEKILKKYFTEHFVLFKPKDKVSGDFYWWANIENHIVITAADGTGHGVPGAFMSMLGSSFLREIVQKEFITNTGEILNRLRQEIIKTLKQKGNLGEQKDGMDMAIISIDRETNIVQFSGANNPLYIITSNVRNLTGFQNLSGLDGFYEIKPDKMPIAIYSKMSDFKTHEIQLEKGDQLYMFSDGYADQFGGESGKKFKSKALKKLLIENAKKTMKEQKEILLKTFIDWKGDLKQIDDVVVLGIKI